MLKCEEVSELVTSYSEGALPLGARLSVRLHLLVCRMCRNYVDQLQKTRRLLRGRAMAPPPEGMVDRVPDRVAGGERPAE